MAFLMLSGAPTSTHRLPLGALRLVGEGGHLDGAVLPRLGAPQPHCFARRWGEGHDDLRRAGDGDEGIGNSTLC